MQKILLLTCLCLLALVFNARAQTTVSGTVKAAENGEPLPGVNVLIQNTTVGTVTDVDGSYALEIDGGDKVLVFSFIGFESQQVPVAGRSVINVEMQQDVNQLDEVVVVGYGTQKEKDLTSAITTVDAEEIAKTPTSQAMQALQGRVAGVQIVSSGEPGAGPTVRIRGIGSIQGSSSPLYVVDGMFFDDISFLNTADIETISVLKDASAAAIYGVRAANGVVIIETKSGSYNQAPEIVYDGYYGMQVAQNVIKMANAEQFTQYIQETGAAADMSFIDNAFERYGRSRINPNVPDVNTDWYKEILKPGPMQNHSLSISGGGDRSKYSVATSYFNQEGLLQDTRNSYERFNLRSKLDFDVTDNLKVGGNINISNSTRFNASNAVWFNAYFAVPILPVFDEQNIDAAPLPLSNAQELGYRGVQNPFYNLHYNDNRSKRTDVMANFHADLDIIPNKLSFRSSYNLDFGASNRRNVNFQNHNGRVENISSIGKGNSSSMNQIWDNTLTFNENIGRHNVTAMAGYSYRSESYQGLSASGTELDPAPERGAEELWYLSRAKEINEDGVNDYGGKFYGTSYFGRIAYNYDDRYMLYGTFRRDGTNKFQKKWGNFPTIGAGWVVSEENFFNVGFIDFFKLRGSWGKLGNDRVPAAIGSPTLSQIKWAIADQMVSGNYVENSFDLLAEWETTVETNVGITANLFDNKLSVDADYYIRDTENAALTIVPPFIRTSYRRNLGVLRNSGLEVALGWSADITNDISYAVGVNMATLKNEVMSLAGQQYLTSNGEQRSIVGEPLRAFYGYEVTGVFQNEEQITSSGLSQEFVEERSLEPGDFIYKDQNGDGAIDDNDRVVLGSYLPDLTYGFNLGVNYKELALTANFQGQTGQSIYNRKRAEVIWTTDANIDADLATNLWRGEGTSNKYPSAAGLRKGWNQEFSDYFLEDGSYFRIQNVRLSYRLIGKQLFGNNLPETRITFTAERPLTLFDYNGFNPEVSSGVDRQTYPIPGVYTLGLNIKL